MTTLYQHVSCPEWGKAQLIEEVEDKRTFLFWDGTKRTFRTAHWAMMEPVETGGSERGVTISVSHQTFGISDPKIAIASLYLLMPTVKQPPAIARCLATQSFLR